MFQLHRRWGWVATVVIIVTVIGFTILFYNSPPSLPSVSLPRANGYDDFIAAQQLLVSSNNDPWRSDTNLTLATAQPFVESNAPALTRLRVGLAKEWQVPVQYSTNWISQHLSDLSAAKRFGHRFSIEGYVAEQNGRFGDAANSYGNGIHFGAASAHGGLLIDWLVAVAVENLQFGPLESIVDKLDVNQCKQTIAELQAAATNYESFSIIVKRDEQWSWYYNRQLGSFRAILNRVGEMIRERSLHPETEMLGRAKQKIEPSLLRLQRLQAALAARAFELEHHTAPKNWSDLVPKYLPVVPTNSETGRPLTHQF